MRPVYRGPVPNRPDGSPKTVSKYSDWRLDLITRMGAYCSYCNMILPDSPQVEHVAPKSHDPAARLLDWNNLLLACGPCNRAKSDTECPPTTHLLPDYHNTHLGFAHVLVPHPVEAGRVGCVLRPRPGLAPAQLAKALATIELCKLNIVDVRPGASDLRWQYRLEALAYAKLWRAEWDSFIRDDQRTTFFRLLPTAALSKGFFSVWFDVFSDIPAVKAALIGMYAQTEPTCFDAANGFVPVKRVPNDL